MNKNSLKSGYLFAVITSIMTFITFGIAICTPPISGPWCQANCIEYPYLDIISRFPRDYYWMFPAIVTTLLFVVFVALVFENAPSGNKIWGLIGLTFATISAIILVADYFIQISVIQPSLLQGETEGIPILTQYNPHGIFIALEEIGYLIMSLALFFLFPLFSPEKRGERAIRLIFLSGFPINLAVFLIILMIMGNRREYLFEVIVISVTWIVLLSGSLLTGRLYRRQYIDTDAQKPD